MAYTLHGVLNFFIEDIDTADEKSNWLALKYHFNPRYGSLSRQEESSTLLQRLNFNAFVKTVTNDHEARADIVPNI